MYVYSTREDICVIRPNRYPLIMTSDNQIRLEVSGWDANKYFIEYLSDEWTELHLGEEGQIQVKKQRPKAGNGGPPLFRLLIQIGSGISVGLISNWIYENMKNPDGERVEIEVEIDTIEMNENPNTRFIVTESISEMDKEEIRELLEGSVKEPDESNISESTE